jgi:hypothetical protein
VPIHGNKAVHDKVKEVFAQLEKARAAEAQSPPEGEGAEKRYIKNYRIGDGLSGKAVFENVLNIVNKEWGAGDSVKVQRNQRTHGIIVIASEADHKRVQELIEAIEAMEKSKMEEPTLEVYSLTMDANITRNIVLFLLGIQRTNSEARVKVEVIEKSKTLLVLGYKADHENVKTVLSKLPQGEEAVVNVKGKEYVIVSYSLPKKVEDIGLPIMADFIRTSAPGVTFINALQENKMFIVGTRAGHAKVKAMLEQMEKVQSAE